MMGGFGFGGRLSDDDLDRTRQGPRMIKERVLLLPALLDLSMPGTSGIDRLWTYLDPFGRQVVSTRRRRTSATDQPPLPQPVRSVTIALINDANKLIDRTLQGTTVVLPPP
jgi:hypothetical protein